MAQWATFAGVTGVVLVLLLALSHLTQSAFSDGDSTASDGADTASSPSASAASARDDASRSEPTTDEALGPEPGSESPTGEEPDSEPGSDAPESEADRHGSSGSSASDDGDGPADADSSADANAGTGFESDLDARVDHGDRSERATDRTAAERATGDRSGRSPSESVTVSGSDPGYGTRPRQGVDPQSLSSGELLANVALSQGLFASVLLGAVVYTGIPVDALGVEFSTAYLRQGIAVGTAVGLLLYAANEIGAAAATRFGFDHDEQLRALLAPETMRGWLVLLAFVLPLIAGFEELLFRAALIGALSTGFGVDPWLLALVSSIAFALGHGMQGSVGIVVTGLLGFVLAAVYVVTGSFLVVVVAHYLINALEFAVHEGLGFDWAETLES